MKQEGKTVFVTGGAGFIGSNLVRRLVADTGMTVVTIDKLTYAGNLDSLVSVEDNPRHIFEKVDICNAEAVRLLFKKYRPAWVMHLAAESHVDRSIEEPFSFIQTNIVGTFTLLQQAMRFWETLNQPEKDAFRFLHVSTDEVYGTLGETGFFNEQSPYDPRSPYAASKAASDHLVSAWYHTYGFPMMISNCSNNYGPCQFPEKLIPHMILRALNGQFLPVYGTGTHVRDWLYVGDHVTALRTIMEKGRPGETYNIGSRSERKNIETVTTLCQILDELLPQSRFRPHRSLIEHVADRPGHDYRYAMSPEKISRELDWAPLESFESGLRKTVEWYITHRPWWERILKKNYSTERIGLIGKGGAQSCVKESS